MQMCLFTFLFTCANERLRRKISSCIIYETVPIKSTKSEDKLQTRSSNARVCWRFSFIINNEENFSFVVKSLIINALILASCIELFSWKLLEMDEKSRNWHNMLSVNELTNSFTSRFQLFFKWFNRCQVSRRQATFIRTRT